MITCLDGWKDVRCKPHELRGHVRYLSRLGRGKYVTEFGFQVGKSALAFLEGGCKSLWSYDIVPCEPYASHLRSLYGDRFRWQQADTSTMPAIDPCDVLLIDSSHETEQTYAELSHHEARVSDAIVLHDTVKFASALQPAIDRFLENHCWHVSAHFPHSHGLTVLRRQA